MIVDSVLGLVGNTGVAALDAGGRPDVLVKLDGDNPSGSIFDRLLTSAVFVGGAVAVRQHDVLAAALALATGSLGLPLTLFTDSPASNSARMAAAFGAKVVPSTEREPMCAGVALEPEKALAALVEECALVRGHDKDLQVVIPPVVPFVDGGPVRGEVAELASGSVWAPMVRSDPAARQRLARHGLLVDALSATCVEWAVELAAQRPGTTVVAVAACDGAIVPDLDRPTAAGGACACMPA
jgi:hypothetical protein